ncbi:Asparagine--tRNA ligase, chloroplastic/mitochondrial [Vitis vinifera]|uniref:Asparagine--tRNA ligase, chloroplastic/mitochondrial n=1 Tax=Vitis vinifera TaxID=29760 RepID=A0A438K394_VITVI|nr:Asparagine--tRNA ligase, chloroplastic/mitochondrial [Vitis vinifera]
MAAALAPVVSLRLKPQSAVRHLLRRSFFFGVGAARPRRRCFCTAISGALSSGEAIEKPKPEFFSAETGEKVGEFRKRLRVVDIKGGPDEGLDRLGQTLAVKGWVRTLRVQSSVIFIEVNDGSCLSNMQCVMNSDADGYEQADFYTAHVHMHIF